MMLREFFKLSMSMLFLWVVADEGGIVDDEGGIVDDDFLIDDPEPTPPKVEDKSKDDTPAPQKSEKPIQKDALDDETKKKIDALEADKEARDIEGAILSAVENIQVDYPAFDIDKVSGFLQQMHKTDPQKAQSYNSPAGWEAIWLKNFATSTEDGTFDPGRKNSNEPFEFDKIRQKALSGDKKSMKKLFENAK